MAHDLLMRVPNVPARPAPVAIGSLRFAPEPIEPVGDPPEGGPAHGDKLRGGRLGAT
jgi:hypothetical protein